MLKPIQTYFEYGNLFCGIEHTTQKGKDVVFITTLKKTKKALDVENTHQISSFEEIISCIAKKQHISLVINNDHVLSKQIEAIEVDNLKLAYNAFPNINLDDFYYEIIHQQNKRFVTICRKSYVEELLKKYSSHGYFVINISLGNDMVFAIQDFIKNEAEVITSNAAVFFDNQDITSIKKIDVEDYVKYDFSGLEVTNNFVLSTSSALNTLLNNVNVATNFDDLKLSLLKTHKQYRFFNVFLKFGLISILVALLINFLVFNHYYNEVKILEQTSQFNNNTKQKMIKLSDDVTKSQKMVEDMLKSNASKSSYYVNAIMQSLPNSILLSELNYQPLSKRIKAGEPIIIDRKNLLIGGQSNHSESFSKWLVNVENMPWVEAVTILNYEDASKSNSRFLLKLLIKND